MDAGKIMFVIFLVIVGYFLFKKFCNPASLSHDSTILFTGGLGSGKSLNSVKVAIKAYKRYLRSWKLSCFKVRFLHWLWPNRFDLVFPEKPLIKSNMPIKVSNRFNRVTKRFEPVFSKVLTRDDLTLKTRLPEHSVVVIDEMPQFLNQFQWESAQGVLNEFITFFRHYVDGLLVTNAQSLEEVECHIRRKLSSYYYCFDFQPFFFLFYRVHILKCRVGDAGVSLTNEYIDDNAKWHYGLLLFKPYASRWAKHRYDRVTEVNETAFDSYYSNNILRFDETGYVSPLDDAPEVSVRD